MLSDPWSGTSSPAPDPWQPLANIHGRPMMQSDNAWLPTTHSPAMGASTTTNVEGWLNSSSSPMGNGNNIVSASSTNSPWLGGAGGGVPQKIPQSQPPLSDPWLGKQPTVDPWQPNAMNNANNSNNLISTDPWSPNDMMMGGGVGGSNTQSPIGTALTSPSSDLDEFDVITNRSKSAQSTKSPINGANNNNCKLIEFR